MDSVPPPELAASHQARLLRESCDDPSLPSENLIRNLAKLLLVYSFKDAAEGQVRACTVTQGVQVRPLPEVPFPLDPAPDAC